MPRLAGLSRFCSTLPCLPRSTGMASLLAATAIALSPTAVGAQSAMPAPAAQAWPAKPVRLIVPFPVGAAPDVIARLVGDKLSMAWGQAVVVENRAGAGGIPGMSTLVRSPADGYTLGFVPAAVATLTPLLYRQPQFSMGDVAPVAMVGTSPMMVVVPSTSSVHTLGDLVAAGKAQPGKVNFAAAQTHSVPHLTGEVLSRATGMGLFVVPYSGSPAAITALLGGDAAVTIDGLPALMQHVKAGKFRPLAVTSRERLPGFETIPTVAETVPNFESIGWFGIFAPAGVPAAIVEQVNRDVNRVVQSPDMVARFAELGVYPQAGSPADLAAYLRDQQAVWRKVVADLGLSAQ
ncbi:exported protein [Pigmentiphaga litoralis]|uniref:Bug family tripartite tricarboxylate transporter substrate binding protein n=1 Tax=Pigmentiphaga litoralis TaxID=516702 RepID=UPI00167382AB|nr:tripartite tricarboxylate transporter substrate binding protein [Pigmentiphaga litoralis]GGX06277.1 exported protein [Pigmentiphaga litoralis]